MAFNKLLSKAIIIYDDGSKFVNKHVVAVKVKPSVICIKRLVGRGFTKEYEEIEVPRRTVKVLIEQNGDEMSVQQFRKKRVGIHRIMELVGA